MGQLRDEEELLELLLTYSIPRRDTRPIAHRLFTLFGSIERILTADADVVANTSGIAEHSVTLLKVVASICQRMQPEVQAEIPEAFQIVKSKPDLSVTARAEPAKATQATPSKKKSSPRARTGLFGKAVLREAIEILPKIPDTTELTEIRDFLRESLHFSAEQTRARNANYITQRMFPDGVADSPFRIFARRFAGTPELREICFYRFCKAEPLMLQVSEDLIIPALGLGRISREKLRAFLSAHFPGSKSLGDCAKAIVDALVAGGIADADRRQISFGARRLRPASFGFILHSEFAEPGIYPVALAESNRHLLSLLWTPESILSGLYELRNLGVISKISEIDSVRQFTLKFDLLGAVNHVVKGGKVA